MREEDVPAEQPEATQDTRLPDPHAYERRPSGDTAPPDEGPFASVSLIWRIRDRASFRALARGRRRRLGALAVSTAALGTRCTPPRVAYALDRRVGGAIARNRVRRRLRAAVRAQRELLQPGHGYLVAMDRSADRLQYVDLERALRAILTDLRSEEA